MLAGLRGDSLTRAILNGMFTVGALTLIVKGVGFLKELMVATRFGTADVLDAFTSGFIIWTFVAGVIGGGLPDALVPVYSRLKQRNPDHADALAVNSIWIYLGILLSACGALYLSAGTVVPLFTKNYSPEKQALALDFFRALAPFGVFWSLAQLFTMLLQANKRFALASAIPIVIPIISILALTFLFRPLGINALVYGAVFGSIIQVAVLYYAFFRYHCRRKLTQPAMLKGETREVARESLPLLAGGVLMGSTLLVDNGMAAWLDSGSVAVLAYGERICSIVLTLAATVTSQTFLPFLSDLVAQKDWRILRLTALRFACLIGGLMLPVVAFIWMFAPWIVEVLFEHGAFDPNDTERVAGVLRFYSLQIPFYVLATLGSRVVIAMQATRLMLITTAVNIVLNTLGNYVFLKWIGLNGIALSTAVVYAISALMLYSWILVTLRRREKNAAAEADLKPQSP